MKQLITILLLLTTLFISCSKPGATTDTDTNFSMSINDTSWKVIGGVTWDVNSGGINNSIFLLTAGDETEPEFGFTVNGASVKVNTPIKITDGQFVPHIVHTYNGIDYDTQFGTSGAEVGTITFTSISDNSIAGTFQAKLTNNASAIITLTNGTFNVPLKRF
jgi:hypothetical protein